MSLKASCSVPSLASVAETEHFTTPLRAFHLRRIPNSSSFRKVRSETDLHNLDKHRGAQFYSDSPKLAIKSKHRAAESEAHLNPTRMGGFGVTGGNGGHSNKNNNNNNNNGGRDRDKNRDRDAYYQKMLEGHPGDPLLLRNCWVMRRAPLPTAMAFGATANGPYRNYAGFLYEAGHELDKAEEYYERAVLANPGDGDVLAMYAKLLWESRNDPQRAQLYFDRAVQAAPDDCYVLASHAHFLWKTEEEEEEEAPKQQLSYEASSGVMYG